MAGGLCMPSPAAAVMMARGGGMGKTLMLQQKAAADDLPAPDFFEIPGIFAFQAVKKLLNICNIP